MKSKIILFITGCFLFITGCLLMISCGEDFITEDFVKGSYVPGAFYDNKDRANMALNAAYSTLNGTFASNLYIMNMCLTDDIWGTGNIAGWGNWGNITDFNVFNTFFEVNLVYNTCYSSVLMCNAALESITQAQAIAVAKDPSFTEAYRDVLLGQVYFIRAYSYYVLYRYWPQNRLVLRRTVPKVPSEYIQAPSPKDSIFHFMESDLKKAQNLLQDKLNTTAGYDKGRITRGTATALLGRLYVLEEMWDEAAAEFVKLLPTVGDAAYGTYSLMPDFRDNFTAAKENNAESIFEIQFYNVSENGQEVSSVLHNWTLNRKSNKDMWWNMTVPNFRLNEFERWTENIGGVDSTVYDYRVYETFWGVQKGAKYAYTSPTGTVVKDWVAQGWATESVIAGLSGVYGIRKYSYDNSTSYPKGGTFQNSDINFRIIRLADVMLMYAECLAHINPLNVDPADVTSAIYWVDKVRDRANNVMSDQSHLFSARTGVRGQLPTATDLMTAKGWTLLQLIEHERYVELFGEGWRGEDLKRWKKDASFIQYKAGWTGYQSLTLPLPQSEIDNNPLMPRD